MCVWLKAQDVHRSCVVPFRTRKIVSSHKMFHRTLLGVLDTFSSSCSSPPQTTPTSRPLTGIRSTAYATSPEGRQSGHLAEPLLQTSEEDALGARKPVTMKQQGQFISYSSSSSSTAMPINQRKWNDISPVGRIGTKAYNISKLMTRLLRHQRSSSRR